MAQPQGRSAAKRIGGVALMLLGVALIGYGSHYLAKNGNCSGTGYASYGPVPKCSGGEAFYIVSVFFLGPVLALVGWGLAGLGGVLWPALCISMGIGLITLRADATATSGAKAFGLVVGSCFVALAVVAVIRTVRKRLRPNPALAGPGLDAAPAQGTAHLAVAPASPGPVPGGPQPASGYDPLDRIAKLAQLRDSGALTEEEFQREKAELLDQT
jgi:hypothetical protein